MRTTTITHVRVFGGKGFSYLLLIQLCAASVVCCSSHPHCGWPLTARWSPLQLRDALPPLLELRTEYKEGSIYWHNPILLFSIPPQYMARYSYTEQLIYLKEILHINFKFEMDITCNYSHDHGRKTKKLNLLQEVGLWIYWNSWNYSTIWNHLWSSKTAPLFSAFHSLSPDSPSPSFGGIYPNWCSLPRN